MSGLATERSASILGFAPGTSNALPPRCRYESHFIDAFPKNKLKIQSWDRDPGALEFSITPPIASLLTESCCNHRS